MPSRYPTIAAGDLRQRVQYKRALPTVRVGFGGFDTPFADPVTHYARVDQLRGALLYNAAQQKAGVWYSVVCRPIKGIKPTDVLTFEGLDLVVEFVDLARATDGLQTIHAVAQPLDAAPPG